MGGGVRSASLTSPALKGRMNGVASREFYFSSLRLLGPFVFSFRVKEEERRIMPNGIEPEDEEMLLIDDGDGDTDTDLDPCQRRRCNCPRASHEGGVGACNGCGDCVRFVS